LQFNAGGVVASAPAIVWTGLTGVVRAGYQHESFRGPNFNFEDGSVESGDSYLQDSKEGNFWSSVGVRNSWYVLPTVGVGLAGEVGYRVNSRAKDHPYAALEASVHGYTIGPVLGVSVNTNNLGEDFEETTCRTTGRGTTCQTKENRPLSDSAGIYFGIKVGL